MKVILTFIIGILCLSLAAQNPQKKPLKDWKMEEAKKPEHIKIVKFLKEQKEIIREDSVRGLMPEKNKEDKEAIINYYQDVGKRIIARREKDSTLLLKKMRESEWNKQSVTDTVGTSPLLSIRVDEKLLVASDSIAGTGVPAILESYWMDEFGEKITRVPANGVAYLFIRTQGYSAGSKVKVKVYHENGKAFSTGEKIIRVNIYTDEDGVAIWANNIW